MKSFWNEKIIDQFKWYYDKGYITARDGNAAYHHSHLGIDKYVVTASGSEKNYLTYTDFVEVNEEGLAIEGPYACKAKPSIETGAHLIALIGSKKHASVHVHSPNTVALAAIFERDVRDRKLKPTEHALVSTLNSRWPELFRYTSVGPIVPFLDPGSQKLHDSIEHCLGYWSDEPVFGKTEDGEEIIDFQQVKKYHDIVILQRHGVLAIGNDLDECMEHIVRLEHICGILLKIVMASSGNLESIL